MNKTETAATNQKAMRGSCTPSHHPTPAGALTITASPAQPGAATLVGNVPTGTISRHEASAAKKSKKCKKGQIKIKRKCRPATTVTGSVSATGAAGVPLALTVKPSGKIRSLLVKGKTVHLTATLTYKSALGGAPTVQVFHVTVKGKRKGKGGGNKTAPRGRPVE